VPSFNGRIVAAMHLELFTPDQQQRQADVERAFTSDDPAERARIIDKYRVTHVLISRAGPYADCIHAETIEAESDDLVLMDALRWLAAERNTVKRAAAVWPTSIKVGGLLTKQTFKIVGQVSLQSDWPMVV
jgi:hypothetical protein